MTTETPETATASLAPRTVQRRPSPLVPAAWIIVGVILMTGVVGGVRRGLEKRPNWGSLQREATYVWEQRATNAGTAMFGYLPTATFALWPFMVWPPQPLGLCLYVASNVAAAIASLVIVRRWWLRPDQDDALFVVVAVMVAANLQHVIQANQLTLWTLLLCAAGLALAGHERPFAGGIAVGLAGLIKTMPLVLAGYFLLRRQWRALAGIAVAAVLFDALPSLLWFGRQGAVDEHRAWLQRCEWHSSRRQIENPLLIGVYRHTSNFSYASVLTRWLRGLPAASGMVVLSGNPPAGVLREQQAGLGPDEVLVLAPMPPPDKPWDLKRESLADVPRFHLTSLSAPAVWWIWAVTLAAGGAVLAGATWRTAGRQRADWAPASAIWLLSMFFLTPMMRHYYFALATPAIAIVWQTLVDQRQAGGSWTAGCRLAVAALIAWVIGVFTLGWDLGRWYGLHLGVAALLAAATAWAWRRSLRPPPASETP